MVPKGNGLREDTKEKTNSTFDFPSNSKASEASVPLEGRRKKDKKEEKTNYIILN